MIERVSALPGVMSAGAIDHMPLRFGMEVAPFSIVGSRPPTGDPIEIVGVVEDGKYQSLGEDPTLAVFVPLSQRYGSWTTVTPLPLGQGLRAIRDAVLQLDLALTLFNTGTLKDQLALPFFPGSRCRFCARYFRLNCSGSLSHRRVRAGGVCRFLAERARLGSA